MAGLPYLDLNTHLRGRFGARVQKLTLDAGLTCPNRDGRVGTGGCLYCNARGSGTGAWARGLSLTAQLQEGMSRLTAPLPGAPEVHCLFPELFQHLRPGGPAPGPL